MSYVGSTPLKFVFFLHTIHRFTSLRKSVKIVHFLKKYFLCINQIKYISFTEIGKRNFLGIYPLEILSQKNNEEKSLNMKLFL